MKIFLYSDQIKFNNPLDHKLFQLVNPTNAKIGFIPAKSDTSRKYYDEKSDWYRQYGAKKFFYFDLGLEYDEHRIDELMSCDIIHLSGGDTHEFIKNIVEKDFKKVLLNYLEKGGVLVGISAGSYVMTPSFKIRFVYTEYSSHDVDFSGMALVDFEFLPHYQKKEQYLDKFIKYSKTNDGRKIYLCRDDCGVFVNNNEIEPIGDVQVIQNGVLVG